MAEYRSAYPAEDLAGARLDVVEIGFWTADQTYEPPEENHRAMMRESADPVA